MRMNSRMRDLLSKHAIDVEKLLELAPVGTGPALISTEGCVFLKDEYEKSKHIAASDFPDLTGLECLINRVWFSSGDDTESLKPIFAYVGALRAELTSLRTEGRFLVIASIDDESGTVRFHKCRPRESWLADDLDGYKEEAVLAL